MRSLAMASIILVLSLWSLWSFAVWIGSEVAIPYSITPPKVPEISEILEEPSIKVMLLEV
jgi:hypothetical protein